MHFLLLALALMFSTSCAALDKELDTIANDPDTAETVQDLVAAAGRLLQNAISRADRGHVVSRIAQPDGNTEEHDVAAELRAIKAALDSLPLPQ